MKRRLPITAKWTPEDLALLALTRTLLGQRICKLREAQGLTIPELAERCEINRSHMREIEKGEISLTLQTILAIAKALKVSVSELFRGIPPKRSLLNAHQAPQGDDRLDLKK